MFKHLLNLIIQKIYLRSHETVKHKDLSPEMYEFFKQSGEGIYYATFQAASSKSSKLIGKYCEGLSHCFAMLYSENLRSWFTANQWSRIEKRWKLYYGSLEGIDKMKVLVLGSADPIGMNYFDFSAYQRRHCCIRKVPNTIYSKETQQKVSQWFIEVPYHFPYDFVGLFGYLISNKVYDKYAYYCSNQIYEGMKADNIFVADRWNPKPSHIQRYNNDWIIYNSLEVCK
jgi:hypothetical protein